MSMRSWTTAFSALAVALVSPVVANAADMVSGGYATSSVAYHTEECSLLRVIEPDRNEVVRVCYPPLDLNPRRRPVAGSSGGTAVSSAPSYAVQ